MNTKEKLKFYYLKSNKPANLQQKLGLLKGDPGIKCVLAFWGKKNLLAYLNNCVTLKYTILIFVCEEEIKTNFQESFQSNTAPFLLIQISFLHRSLLLLSKSLLADYCRTLAGVKSAKCDVFLKKQIVFLWSKVHPVVCNKYPGMLEQVYLG